MVRVKGFPYILPSDEHVRTVEWLQRIGDADIPLQEMMPHWDPSTTLHISVKVATDIASIYSYCRLAPDDRLRLVLVWHSPGTNLRGCGSYVDINNTSASLPVTLHLHLPGELLSDRVRIETQLILAEHGKSSLKLSPQFSGSILWHEEKTILLEGLASRFPVELIDFADTSWLPENASWFLDWDDTDLELMALRALRLFINTRNSAVRRSVAESLSSDEVIRDIIQFDVGRTMIIGALENEPFVQNPEAYAEGSIGNYVRRLIRTLFPNESWEGIANLYRQNRSRFECELQDRFKLFQGV